MPETTTSASEEAQIRERVEALAQKLRTKDVDALMTHYAPDMVTFDVRPPQQIQGADRYRENFETWFASVEGPIDYQVRDLRIATNGDVAFCHSLCRVKSTRKSGETAEYWVRVTSGLRKLDGQWLITHEHVSLPINMPGMQAELALRT